MMEQGELDISPDLHHSPDIEILPDDEIDLTSDDRRRGSDREDHEESLTIKPPQVHLTKKDKHKHKHKDDRKRDRDRSGRHGDREKERGKHKDRREKDKLPKESSEERSLREARERAREHERERYRRKEMEVEAKRREKSQRERPLFDSDRLERLERERRKLEREREQSERQHRDRLKQEQDRQERQAKFEREQERLAKATREQERLAEAEKRYATKDYDRKLPDHVVKDDRHRGSSEREYEKERARGERGERGRRRGGEEERRKHSTRHEVERRRDKERAPRSDKREVRERSRSPYSTKKDTRGQHYEQRADQRYRHKDEPLEEDDLDRDLEHLYRAQHGTVTMETTDSDQGRRLEPESEPNTSSGSSSDSDSEDSESDSQLDSEESPRSQQLGVSEEEESPGEHHRHVKSKFDDDDNYQDDDRYDDEEEEAHYHDDHRSHRHRQQHHRRHSETDQDQMYEGEEEESRRSDEEIDEENENGDHYDQPSDYLETPPPASPIELAPVLPPYLPAIQGCRNVEEFHCLNRIEEGTYGVVYRARDNKTGELVALKRLKMEKEKEGFPITSLREINTLLKAQHSNIVTVREIVVGSNMDKIYIVMDYVEHDLKSLMQTMKDPFTIGEVKTLMQQLLRGVAHLHDNWIIHRDLKTSNLLLSHNGILKIGDFGLAREYGSPLKPYTAIVVTLWYRSPELLLGIKEYSTYIDLWSVGCIFAEFLTMKPLFPGKSEIDQLNRIFKELGTPNEKIWPGVGELPVMKKCTFAEYPYNTLRKRFSSHLSDRGFDLMNRFLTYDPSRRLTAREALDHDHFVESPLPVPPSMFPTWPAKSEQSSRQHGNTPRPPSGGKAYDKLLGDDDEALAFGFHIGSSAKGGAALGFKLKF